MSVAGLGKVIIDTDPGVDDAMAILMLLKHKGLPGKGFDVIGITTVYGNAHVARTTANALFLLDVAGRPDIPVFPGADRNLQGGDPHIADFVHGKDGLGDAGVAAPVSRSAAPERAADAIARMARENPGEVTILALGPITNVARAFRDHPETATNLKRIVFLGGAFKESGNVNPAAEANIFSDPLAADEVFTSGVPMDVVSLDVTTMCNMDERDLDTLAASGANSARVVAASARFYMEFYRKVAPPAVGVPCTMHLHDPAAALYLIHPELFEVQPGCAVRVITDGFARGHTITDWGHERYDYTATDWAKRCITIATKADGKAVREMCMKLLTDEG